MSAIVWLVAGILLVAAEAATGDLFLLMLGSAALATAGVVGLTEFPLWADGVIFTALAVLLLVVVRPPLKRRFSGAAPTATNVAALMGKKALVLAEVNVHAGQIKLDGDVWTARPFDETQVYEPGDSVTVMRIDGATAVVWKES